MMILMTQGSLKYATLQCGPLFPVEIAGDMLHSLEQKSPTQEVSA